MKQIEIPFKGKLVYKTEDDDMPLLDLEEQAMLSVVIAENRANAIGDFRIHIEAVTFGVIEEPKKQLCDGLDLRGLTITEVIYGKGFCQHWEAAKKNRKWRWS